MSTKKYSKDNKERLVTKINKLGKKEHFVSVFNIIQKHEQKPVKEIGNTTTMFFHDLKDDTYREIDKFLKLVSKKKTTTETTENTEYKPYSQDEYPLQKNISPKLKYSNKEKNLIKRRQYDENLMEENGSDVIYCKFNVDNITDTDNNTTEKQK